MPFICQNLVQFDAYFDNIPILLSMLVNDELFILFFIFILNRRENFIPDLICGGAFIVIMLALKVTKSCGWQDCCCCVVLKFLQSMPLLLNSFKCDE